MEADRLLDYPLSIYRRSEAFYTKGDVVSQMELAKRPAPPRSSTKRSRPAVSHARKSAKKGSKKGVKEEVKDVKEEVKGDVREEVKDVKEEEVKEEVEVTDDEAEEDSTEKDTVATAAPKGKASVGKSKIQQVDCVFLAVTCSWSWSWRRCGSR